MGKTPWKVKVNGILNQKLWFDVKGKLVLQNNIFLKIFLDEYYHLGLGELSEVTGENWLSPLFNSNVLKPRSLSFTRILWL